jgi:hypothetical protein
LISLISRYNLNDTDTEKVLQLLLFFGITPKPPTNANNVSDTQLSGITTNETTETSVISDFYDRHSSSNKFLKTFIPKKNFCQIISELITGAEIQEGIAEGNFAVLKSRNGQSVNSDDLLVTCGMVRALTKWAYSNRNAVTLQDDEIRILEFLEKCESTSTFKTKLDLVIIRKEEEDYNKPRCYVDLMKTLEMLSREFDPPKKRKSKETTNTQIHSKGTKRKKKKSEEMNEPDDLICYPPEEMNEPDDLIYYPPEEMNEPDDLIYYPPEEMNEPDDLIYYPPEEMNEPDDLIYYPPEEMNEPDDNLTPDQELPFMEFLIAHYEIHGEFIM